MNISPVLLLLVLGGFVWVLHLIYKASADIDSLNALVSHLRSEVQRLRQRLDQELSSKPGDSDDAPTSSALTQLRQTRAESRTAPTTAATPHEPGWTDIQSAPATASSPPPLPAAIAAQVEETAPALTSPSLPPLIQPASVALTSREPEPALVLPAAEKKPAINWERFMGVNLFAWVGGLALFLGVAFFIKYSFEHNLIPPEVRVALGFLTGIGLLVGGVVMKRKEFAVTSQTLCATGILILYAVSFACHAYYHFTGAVTTFALMILITATAFLLAVRMDAKVVAILGMVGGFLTPPLLSTGVDNPLGLFTYIALLDLGLLAVAFHRRWHFLVLMGAIGTVIMQLGWTAKFFAAEKAFVALAIFLAFDVLFLLAFVAAQKLKQINSSVSASSVLLPFITLGFAIYLLSYPALGARPGTLFSFVLGADLCLLALVLLRHPLNSAHLISGGAAFLILAGWTINHLTAALLNWALGLYFLFAALHSVFPVVLQRLRPGVAPVWWGHLFPPIALLLVMLPLFGETPVSWLIWPCVLMIDLVAIGLALATASLLPILGVLALTVAVTAVWITKIPAELTGLPPMLIVIGGFAVFFFVASIFAEKMILAKLAAPEGPGKSLDNPGATSHKGQEDMLRQIPALSAILPFLLLIMAAVRLPLLDPSPVFGLALLLTVLLLGVARASSVNALFPVGLACVLALEYAWHGTHFTRSAALKPLLWYLGFSAVYLVVPFLFRTTMRERMLPWAVAALAPPLHFFLIYRAVSMGFPNDYLGALPALLSVPMLLGLIYVARQYSAEHPLRNTLLAWFGGSALFFITLIFPIQFSRQWLTIGWALEGTALLWLFHRVPHPGLRVTGVALLAAVFVRLALNPSVLSYHLRSATPIFNWYLYTYAVPALCMMFGARLLAPPRHQLGNIAVPPWLYGAGTVLAFLLLNIEIADYFSVGSALIFQFSGNFARDMTYSIAWALFAFVLLLVGIWKRLPAVRYASLGLLAVTLLKLFVHDLSQLGQLYRIGAFIAVAIILMLASYLYQRFVSWGPGNEKAQS